MLSSDCDMDYLNIETARIVVEALSKETEYNSNTCSAKCPLCGNWGKRIYHCTKHTKNGNIHRYFVCEDCGFRYKAIEIVKKE